MKGLWRCGERVFGNKLIDSKDVYRYFKLARYGLLHIQTGKFFWYQSPYKSIDKDFRMIKLHNLVPYIPLRLI